jgi:mono/diheme cytochrome c family protein
MRSRSITEEQTLRSAWLGLLLVVVAACEQRELTLAERGERTYKANCIACHNPDPMRDGTLGPALAGSPRELIEARVMRAEYPPGYQPKRESKLMQPLPYLADQIDGLAAFLADGTASAGSAAGAAPLGLDVIPQEVVHPGAL